MLVVLIYNFFEQISIRQFKDGKMETEKKWYRLDNAAKIFPATRNSRWTNNFRVSVTLTSKIDPELLQIALEKTLPRFPNFAVTMRRGLFWYYLEAKSGAPKVEPDVSNPCKRINIKENGGFLFRVRYFEKRIAIEIFHVITDGTGATYFLKTLLAQYLKLQGVEVPIGNGVYDVDETPTEEEMEDAYRKYSKYMNNHRKKDTKAYHMKGFELPPAHIKVITGRIQLDKLVEIVKEYKVSITEYLAAVFIRALILRQAAEGKKKLKPVKVCIPVNLRKYYPSKTLRNFVLVLNVGVEPSYGNFTFEEILHEVHHYMRLNLNEKYMNAMMSINMTSELNPLMKGTPLFIKNIGLLVAYSMYGESLSTCTVSNIGSIKVPDEMVKYIDTFDFMFGRSKRNNINAAIVSYKNLLNITFGSKIVDSDVEREFFTFLVKRGIPVKIESNTNTNSP